METLINALKLTHQKRASFSQYDYTLNPYSQSCESTPVSEPVPELINFSQYVKSSEIKRKPQLPPLEPKKSLSLIHKMTKSYSEATIEKQDISNLDSLLRKSKDTLRRKYSVKNLPKLSEFNLETNESFVSDNTQKFTPTFRDLSCGILSKREAGNSKLGEEVKKDGTMFPVSSKKVMKFDYGRKQIDYESASNFAFPKTMKKIKVLRNKFPKDMFIIK